MQGSILKELFKDEVNTKTVSNSFLRAQFQMRVGDFDSSSESIDQTIENAEKIKADFKDDLDIVMAKFMAQKAHINFLTKNYQVSNDAAKECLKYVENVKNDEASIMR